jgi:hypothetical protein
MKLIKGKKYIITDINSVRALMNVIDISQTSTRNVERGSPTLSHSTALPIKFMFTYGQPERIWINMDLKFYSEKSADIRITYIELFSDIFSPDDTKKDATFILEQTN